MRYSFFNHEERRVAAGTLLGGLLALAAAGSAAAAPARQTATFVFSTKEPGRSAGVTFAAEWRDPANPGGKPYSVARVTIEVPAGATTDTGALTRCTASDAEIQAQGGSACPATSRLGGGTIVSDTGSSGGFPRFVENRVVNFNGDHEQIGVADSVNVPPVPGVGRVVTRTSIQGRRSSFDVPGFPGSPPPDNFTAFRSLRLSGRAAGTAARPYFRTPPSCPAQGRWITELTFLYRDGVSQTVRAPSPCKRSSASSTCLSRRSPVGHGGIGRVRLGASRRRLEAVPAGRPLRRRRIVRYCVKGSSGRVLAALNARGRSELVVSTASGHGNRGVRPGRRSALLRAYPLRTALGNGLFSAGPGRRQVIGVRRGRIRFVGVATDRLLGRPASLRRAIARLGS